METFIRVAQFLLSLSILVLLHEWGHYITARMFKTRVEKFYLFFDFLFPFPTVLNFALFKKKIGETEYGLGWFPLGGYVKIAGMVDESMDEEAMKLPPQPDEFRSKKPYQRLIIMLGGIIVNVLLAFVIYAMMLFWWGESSLPVERVNEGPGFAVDSCAIHLGLQDGDKIISYNGGTKFKQTKTVGVELLLNLAKTIEIERNGQVKTIPIPMQIYKEMMASKGVAFVTPIVPAKVDSAYADKPYAKAGGKKGDLILALDSANRINNFYHMRRELRNYKGKNVAMQVLRGGDTVTLHVTVDTMGLVGIGTADLD